MSLVMDKERTKEAGAHTMHMNAHTHTSNSKVFFFLVVSFYCGRARRENLEEPPAMTANQNTQAVRLF